MDLRFSSGEDTFDRALKALPLSALDCAPVEVMEMASVEEDSSDCFDIPSGMKTNKVMYDKIFEEVMTIMKEEEQYEFQPVFSDMFSTDCSQITYSQFVNGIHKVSTQQQLNENDDGDLLCSQCTSSSKNQLCQEVNCVAGKLPINNLCSPLNAIDTLKIIKEPITPSCSKISINNQQNKDKHLCCLRKFSKTRSNESCNKFSDNTVGIKNLKINYSRNLNKSNSLCSNFECKKVEINSKTNYNHANENTYSINKNDETSRLKVMPVNLKTFDKVLKSHVTVNQPGIESVYESCVQAAHCSDFSLRLKKNVVLDRELRVVIDTPFIKKYTQLDILERKLIEYYNKCNDANSISKNQSGNIFRKQTIENLDENNVTNKPDFKCNNDYSNNIKSCVNKELVQMIYEKPEISGNTANYIIRNKCKVADNDKVWAEKKFPKLRKKNAEAATSLLQGGDSSMIMHLMYEALQVGCVKSCGFVRNIIPSLQNGYREDALQFYCKSCVTEYSYVDVENTFDSYYLTCLCPKELTSGVRKVLDAEFSFKLFVEDLSKTSCTYFLVGKEAEIFFGCTVHDFWHSRDSIHSVRRAIKNLLRSYKRKILSEFCLSTKNLFGVGPKYLINVSRETCIAPVE